MIVRTCGQCGVGSQIEFSQDAAIEYAAFLIEVGYNNRTLGVKPRGQTSAMSHARRSTEFRAVPNSERSIGWRSAGVQVTEARAVHIAAQKLDGKGDHAKLKLHEEKCVGKYRRPWLVASTPPRHSWRPLPGP